MLAGQTTPAQIAAYCESSAPRVSRYLQNPVAMRWISDQVQQHLDHRVGIPIAALFARAAQGDVAAIRLLLEKYGQLVHRSQAAVVHLQGADLRHMSSDDLAASVKDLARELGEKDVLEAEFTVKDGSGKDERSGTEKADRDVGPDGSGVDGGSKGLDGTGSVEEAI